MLEKREVGNENFENLGKQEPRFFAPPADPHAPGVPGPSPAQPLTLACRVPAPRCCCHAPGAAPSIDGSDSITGRCRRLV